MSVVNRPAVRPALAATLELVSLEQGVAGRFFAGSEQVVFRRDNLGAVLRRPKVKELVDEFEAMSRPHTYDADRALGNVGLILPATPAYRRARPKIRQLLEDAGYGVEDIGNSRSHVVDLAQFRSRRQMSAVPVSSQFPIPLDGFLVGSQRFL